MSPQSPFKTSNPRFYSRLLPESPTPPDQAVVLSVLSDLGAKMIDVDDETPVSGGLEILVTAGYTYFGQFLDHDLTKDKSSLEDAAKTSPAHLRNVQTPRLDLSHLYEVEPGQSKTLYEKNKIHLRVGTPGGSGLSFDVALERDRTPSVGDSRSAENAIIRQVTAVFARYHNFAVNHCDPVLEKEAPFKRARLQMIWQFQWLVVDDYLRNLLSRDVYAKLFERKEPTFAWDEKKNQKFSIPVEFSVAAMRFGHSMVRQSYLLSLNPDGDKNLCELFGKTSASGNLTDDFEIDWGAFFQGAGQAPTVLSRPIDTRIGLPLHHLPTDLVRLFNVAPPARSFLGDPPQLPVRSLLRGRALNLPTGQAAARAFGVRELTENELLNCDNNGTASEQGKILQEAGLLKDTPLWYYILRESEVMENGNCLGPSGSHIIAETIYAALRSDPNPYSYCKMPKWRPPVWRGLPEGDGPLPDLISFFGMAPQIQSPY